MTRVELKKAVRASLKANGCKNLEIINTKTGFTVACVPPSYLTLVKIRYASFPTTCIKSGISKITASKIYWMEFTNENN
jgi:hypothetical protein